MRAWITSLRWILHLPIGWWLSTLLLALICAITAGSLVHKAQLSQQRLGQLIDVYVTTKTVSQGSVLTKSDFQLQHWPVGFLPQSEPTTQPPVGLVATRSLLKNQPITTDDLAPAGLSPIAALLHPKERAIDIAVTNGNPPNVAVGDQVELISEGIKNAVPGRIVGVDRSSTTVAIPIDQLTALAGAIRENKVVIAVSPPVATLRHN